MASERKTRPVEAMPSPIEIPSDDDLSGGWEDGYGFITGPSIPRLKIKKKYGKALVNLTEEFGPSFGTDVVVQIECAFRRIDEAKAFCDWALRAYARGDHLPPFNPERELDMRWGKEAADGATDA